jgi:hypothetical protein
MLGNSKQERYVRCRKSKEIVEADTPDGPTESDPQAKCGTKPMRMDNSSSGSLTRRTEV